MSVPAQSFKRLKALKDATGADTYTEVISNALRLYEAVLQSEAKGIVFVMRHPDGSEEEMVLVE